MLGASRIVAIACGLLLIVLGHDAIMAADPHAPSLAGAHESHPGHRDHAAPEPAPAPDPTVPCGPLEGVRPQTPVDLDADAPVTSVPATRLSDEAGITVSLIWWQEPAHPPEVRRALLQVFLN